MARSHRRDGRTLQRPYPAAIKHKGCRDRGGSFLSLKYDEAYEEVVARLSESFLRDAHLSEKSKALYNADKSLWQSIKDGLEKVINKIKESFADIAPESRLGKIGQKMVRENQEILDRFVAGIRAASENAAYTENTTDEGGVRSDDRITIDMGEEERASILDKTSISTVTVAKNQNLNPEDFNHRIKRKADKAIINKAKELGIVDKSYKANQVEIDFEFTVGGLRKSLNSQMDYGGNYKDIANILINLNDLLNSAVLIEAHSNKDIEKKNKNLKAVYVLLSVMRENKRSITPIQFEIKEQYLQGNRLYLAVALTKIETGVMAEMKLDNNQEAHQLLPVSDSYQYIRYF